MDTQLVEKIVHEVKSQGVFDEFRKDSMADVDTKPAYQNLRARVENTVKKFLSDQKWTPETNKNQLREKLRRHITESGFLDLGVERIVDQVVNPKIGSVFQPRIEEIAYKYLGIPPPPKKFEPPPPPLMHSLPPLPLSAPPPPLNVETCSLLPNDLEQVSPDSDKATVKSEIEGDDKTQIDMDTEEKIVDDEDESPPFEPLHKAEMTDIDVKNGPTKAEINESTQVDNFKKEDENSNGRVKIDIKKDHGEILGSKNLRSANLDKEVSQSMDCRISQDSQLSSVSSDTRLSPVPKDASLLRSSQEEAVTANISEEAQMPKFNENSSEPSGLNGKNKEDSALHFDIKKDEIKFEGTERKGNVDDSHESPLSEELKCPVSTEADSDNKNDQFKFASNNNSNMEPKEYYEERTPNAQELSFGSSIEDSTSIPSNAIIQVNKGNKDRVLSLEEKSPMPSSAKQPSTPTVTSTPAATPTPPPPLAHATISITTPSPVSSQKTDKDYTRHSSSSSASKHKKHSKERRRSHDREKNKDRYRSSREGKDSKHHSSSGSKYSSNKHSTSSSSKYSSSSSYHRKSNDKDLEKSSSSSHYSSKQSKHSSSDKRRHTSSHRDHSSSSSNTSLKRNERKDDHQEAKQKPRRKSTDSNDDEGDKSGVGKSTSQHNKSSTSNSKLRSAKPVSDVHQSPPNKNNDTQNDCLPQEPRGNDETANKQQIHKNVVILNELLENPKTQCIHLDTRGHLIGAPSSSNISNHIAIPRETHKLRCEDKSGDLLYFEDIQKTFVDRLNILNDTIDLCRRAVNSLVLDSPIDEGIDIFSEDDSNHIDSTSLSSLSASLKRKSNIKFEDLEKTPRKRCLLNTSTGVTMKTSPTSDSSVSSKENEEIDKNTTDMSKKLDRHKAAVQKLTQQQRYSSDDLYKPRPILGQRSRRRGMDSII